MLRNLRIAVAIGALASVALCASYGWDQATDLKDRVTQAFIFGFVAAGTLLLHGVALRICVNGWRKAGAFMFVVGMMAFTMTAFTSLGGLASRSDKVQAERQVAVDAKADTRKQIDDLMVERKALKFTRTTKAGVDAAQRAVDAAKLAKDRECGDGSPRQRGSFCRQKEDSEATALTALAKAQTDKTATDRAIEIDAQLKALRAVKTDGSVGSVNPLEALLTTIFGAWGALLAAWQKALFAVIYDLVLVALMIGIEATAYTSPAPTRSVDMRTKREDSDITGPDIAAPPRPKLVLSGSPRPAGSIPMTLSEALEPGKGTHVEMEEAYAAYAGECRRLDVPAVSPQDFVDPLKRFCSTCRIKTKIVDGKVYLLNVRLARQMVATKEEAPPKHDAMIAS
jgi:hypothetical protein